jgi:hypothetical protein
MPRCTRYIASHEVSASGLPLVLGMAQYRLLFAPDDPQRIQGGKTAENCYIRIVQIVTRSEMLALVRRSKKRHLDPGKSSPRTLLQAVYT